MDRVEFPQSTAVAWASYDRRRRLMQAAYRGEMRVYAYKEVPLEEFRRFLDAGSKGGYINRIVKRRYEVEEVTPQNARQAKVPRKRKRASSRS